MLFYNIYVFKSLLYDNGYPYTKILLWITLENFI